MPTQHRPTPASAALAATAALVLSATAASAQAGRADLRYVAPMPTAIVITTVDSVTSTMTGTPMGDMTTNGVMSSVSELRFEADGDALMVTARLREMSGRISTPMGDMPINMDAGEATTFRMGATGPDPEELYAAAAGTGAAGPGASPEDAMGGSRALSGLLALPGRELGLGETWTDTVRVSPTVDGMTFDMEVHIHGTYARDTVVAGRTLNVLEITTNMVLKAEGTAEGMNIAQEMNSEGEETVLWDSARRMAVHRDATATMTGTTSMPQMGMSFGLNSRTRSIATGALPD
ncbi:MAG TPA: hypothetical protein VK929_01820 [Longimicrobiales bacterium]|nr:hypothetical protein [Longimicrobiales bacterium]